MSLGLAGSMVDFGDRVPQEALFFNQQRGDELHNFYAYDYHRTYQEVFREKRGDDFILFGRAAAPACLLHQCRLCVIDDLHDLLRPALASETARSRKKNSLPPR